MEMLVLIGLPASGKSTFAHDLVRRDHSWRRVNKDDLRLLNPSANEAEIHRLQNTQIMQHIADGCNIVIDNTNLNPRTRAGYAAIAKQHGYMYTEQQFDVAVSECIARDMERPYPAHVGRDVITELALRWGLMEFEFTYIFDIDGTLALIDERRHHVQKEPKDWDSFFAEMVNDKPNIPVVRLWNILRSTHRFNLVCLSGRPANYRKETRIWLAVQGIFPDVLLMRKAGDRRPDDIVKRELYQNYLEGRAIIEGIFDDRNSVVKMWRGLGLPVFQVADGDF